MRYTLFHNQDSYFMRPGELSDTYIMGYSGKLYTSDGKLPHILEQIFHRHNMDDRPDAKVRPSLSVGDVVVLAPSDVQLGEPWMFTVDIAGFKELGFKVDA